MPMSDLIYPPAGRVSSTIHESLRRRHEEARRTGMSIRAHLPQPDVIERLIEAAFWASLRREEGRIPKISLAIVPREEAGDAIVLDRSITLAPGGLTRLAPAVERPGLHLCVWGDAPDLRVWGATRVVPDYSLVVEVFEPGLVVAKYSRGHPYGKYGNLAMFKGDQVKVVDDEAARRPDCPEVLAALTGMDGRLGWLGSTADNVSKEPDTYPNLLLRLAISMRAHGHGGILLVVGDHDSWMRSIVTPIRYQITPPFDQLSLLLQEIGPDGGEGGPRPAEVQQAVDALAGLTAVDGATIINRQYALLAFGAKIERALDSSTVKEVVITEPVVGNVPLTVDAASIGGTRHLSAAQFVHDQRDALAFVASQDGRFTLFAWSDLEDRLYAHRLEALLL